MMSHSNAPRSHPICPTCQSAAAYGLSRLALELDATLHVLGDTYPESESEVQAEHDVVVKLILQAIGTLEELQDDLADPAEEPAIVQTTSGKEG
jgi:hypothetical protein